MTWSGILTILHWEFRRYFGRHAEDGDARQQMFITRYITEIDGCFHMNTGVATYTNITHIHFRFIAYCLKVTSPFPHEKKFHFIGPPPPFRVLCHVRFRIASGVEAFHGDPCIGRPF